ncbi:Ig-like domain-containing protein [Streptomyces flavofungini]|uniref:Ig-like domain-containing protein n=1 Tax=Streptomyces flavofungini TaxID=68200 RepID=UPI0034DFDD9B
MPEENSAEATASQASQQTPYTKQGVGKDACPADSFCLYADIKFNGMNNRKSILVIPYGATANNFSDYGFDQSGDGVSAVINNTSKDNVLFTRIDQKGDQLSVPAKTSIEDLTTKKLIGSPNGTWNDQAQSALAYKEPVPPPVFTTPAADAQVENRREPVGGTADAKVDKVRLYRGKKLLGTPAVSSGKWTYVPDSDWPLGKQELHASAVRGDSESGRVYLNFFVVQPAPTVQITSPKDGAKVDSKTPVQGRAFKADTVDLAEGSTKLGSVPVAGNKWDFTPQDGWKLGSHTVTVEAVKGTQKSTKAQVTFTVEKKNLTVGYKMAGHPWQENGKWIYPYDIKMEAGATDVKRWRVGFGELPNGTVLAKMFTDAFWGMVIEDGSNGRVQLGSPPPEKGKHIVEKGKSLTIRVQVLYPTQEDAHKKLYNLYAEDWSNIGS